MSKLSERFRNYSIVLQEAQLASSIPNVDVIVSFTTRITSRILVHEIVRMPKFEDHTRDHGPEN
jgi:hypothetical protein